MVSVAATVGHLRAASGWVYGDAQRSLGIGPQAFTPGTPPPIPVVDAAETAETTETDETNAGTSCDVEMPTG